MRTYPCFFVAVALVVAGCSDGADPEPGGGSPVGGSSPLGGGAAVGGGDQGGAGAGGQNTGGGGSGGGGVRLDEPTLWVDAATGSDDYTRAEVLAGGGAIKWATVGRAAWGSTDRSNPDPAEGAAAGDVVDIAAGTYTAQGFGGGDEVTYNPVNAGTAESPIVFQASGPVVLALSSPGVAAGANGRSYITWRGFTFDDVTYPSYFADGLVLVQDATGVVIEDCTFIGRTGTADEPGTLAGDNYAGVFTSSSIGLVVRHSTFTGFNFGDSENNAGIDTYYSGDYVFENNRFDGQGAGIYVKANCNLSGGAPYHYGDGTIRFNVFENGATGIRYHRSPNTDEDPVLIHQNVFHALSEGLLIQPFDGGTSDPFYGLVINNTFVDVGVGVRTLYTLAPNSRHLVQNNIFYGGSYAVTYGDEGPAVYSSDRIDFVRNLAHDQASAYGIFSNEPQTLAEWQSSTGADIETVNADPGFMDLAAGDFRLTDSGQVALTLGRAIRDVGGADGDVIPVGAYITGDESIGALP